MAPDADPDSEQKTGRPCRLFDLPQELRDMVYEYACDFEVGIFSTTMRSMTTSWDPNANMRLRAKNTNMGTLKACKQLRAETQKIWYKRSIFHFSSPVACSIWLKQHVPEQSQGVVKELRIACPWWEGQWLLAVRQGRCTKISIQEARDTNKQAQDTLLSGFAQTRQPLLSVLSMGALQVEVFNSNWHLI